MVDMINSFKFFMVSIIDSGGDEIDNEGFFQSLDAERIEEFNTKMDAVMDDLESL